MIVPQNAPDARFDRHGDLTVNFFGFAREADAQHFTVFRRCIENTIPEHRRDWDESDLPSALWVSWQHAEHAVGLLIAFWRNSTVTAAANPNYRPRAGRS